MAGFAVRGLPVSSHVRQQNVASQIHPSERVRMHTENFHANVQYDDLRGTYET